ncbi:hypothetical protein [Domibacillus robiginosus]|uniref:hypothetical protein n=1 Tax=Domibacillus robiginosus TaxID=1071054 RepID=UPI00067B9EBB|nr:hypothetical protein [Domibacillus robiginosus]
MTGEHYVQIGRALGFLFEEEETGRKFFSVGNGMEQVEITEFEYRLWEELRKVDTLDDWKTLIRSKTKKYPDLDLDAILNKFYAFNLMRQWKFDTVDNPELLGIFITRNAYAYGEIEGYWVVGDHRHVGDNVTLNQEQYMVWNAAAGGAPLLQVLDTIMTKLSLTEEEALALLNKEGYGLIQLGLWNTEYLPFLIEEEAQ